jgi:ribonucleoside-diphosphate reductase alpha chain
MSERQRLLNRRASESFAFQCGRMNYVATISRFDDGRVAEIFLTNHKVGSDADAAARDSAVVCSLALQHGTPVETIRKALLRDAQGCPPSPLGTALDIIAAESGA